MVWSLLCKPLFESRYNSTRLHWAALVHTSSGFQVCSLPVCCVETMVRALKKRPVIFFSHFRFSCTVLFQFTDDFLINPICPYGITNSPGAVSCSADLPLCAKAASAIRWHNQICCRVAASNPQYWPWNFTKLEFPWNFDWGVQNSPLKFIQEEKHSEDKHKWGLHSPEKGKM